MFIDEPMHQEHGQMPHWADRNFECQWLELKYSDAIIHSFQQEKRDFYALEELWGNAKRAPWKPKVKKAEVVLVGGFGGSSGSDDLGQ